MRVYTAIAGKPIPSEKKILKMFTITSACLILYLFGVTIFHSTCSLPFFPPYIFCMRSNLDQEILSWQNHKLLFFIPITLIIGANILFDFQDISIVNHYRPLRMSIFSCLFFVTLMLKDMFVNHLDFSFLLSFYIFIGIALGILLVKGPIIAIWTYHQLKQKSLKNPPPKEMNEVELNSICN